MTTPTKILPSTTTVLEKALKLLDGGNRWIKGDYEVIRKDGSTYYCSDGALLEAATCEGGGHNWVALSQARDLLHESLPLLNFGVLGYNDRRDTEWPDIQALFERAIAKAGENVAD